MTEPITEAYEAAARDFSRHKIVTSWLLGSAKWECSCGATEQGREYYAHLNASVVDAVWKIAEATVRAKVAAEIRSRPPISFPVDMRRGPYWNSLSGPYGNGYLEWCARIAEGEGDET